METREKRYSKKNIRKRKIKKGIRELPKKLLKNIIYLSVGIGYIAYFIIYNFNSFIANCFMTLPRIGKVITVYSLIISSILGTVNIVEGKEIQYINVEHIIKETSTITNEVTEELEAVNICPFDEVSCMIYNSATEKDFTEEQVLMAIAISRWETGNYTSDAFYNKNNVGGNFCQGTLLTFNTLEDGINYFLNNLKNNYFDLGLDTLEKIQPKYCPIGADNDPNNLNQYWLSGVTNLYVQLIGK